MDKKNEIKIFEDKKVRTFWDAQQEKWYLSIVDVIAVLTDQTGYQAARNYWKVLKHRLLKEGNETVTNLGLVLNKSAIIFNFATC